MVKLVEEQATKFEEPKTFVEDEQTKQRELDARGQLLEVKFTYALAALSIMKRSYAGDDVKERELDGMPPSVPASKVEN